MTNNSWNNQISAANSSIILNSGTNAVSVSTDTSATTVNVGTGAAAKTVTLGSTTSTSSLALQYGTSDFTLASATGTVMSALDTGEITKPLQPMFLNQINFANNIPEFTTVPVGSETATTSIVDRNSDMTEGDGSGTGATFTAPVTGIYYLSFVLVVDHGGSPDWTMEISTSNRTYMVSNLPALSGASGDVAASGSVAADMDAGDTATFDVTAFGGLLDETDIIGGYISGYLVG